MSDSSERDRPGLAAGAQGDGEPMKAGRGAGPEGPDGPAEGVPTVPEPLAELPAAGEGGPVVGIIGLGAMGTALGLALQKVKTRFSILGHDRDPERVRAARKAGAIDRGHWSVAETAARADLLILAEPLDALLETLADIAPHLRPGTLVTDTAAAKRPVLAAAERLMPVDSSFIGGHPIPRAALTAPDADGKGLAPAILAGRAFESATYGLTPAPGASEDALRVLANLVRSIGAEPMYLDPLEHDGLVGGVQILPYLASGLLARVLDGSPSDRDLRRLAGPPLAAMLDLVPPDAVEAEREAAVALRAGLLHWVDRLAAEIQGLRAALADAEPAALAAFLAEADAARERWRDPRAPVGAEGEPDEAAQPFGLRQLFFGRLGRPRRRPDAAG